MNKHLPLLILLLVFCPAALYAHDPGGSAPADYGNIEFVENRGQWDAPFLFRAATRQAEVYFEPGGFTYLIGAARNTEVMEQHRHGRADGPALLDYHAYRVRFVNASTPVVSGAKPRTHYYNYFLGKDPSKWQSGIHPFLNLHYRGLYPGVDLQIASERGRLKYDFILQPGADPSVIKLRFEGTGGVSVKDGRLQIATSAGRVEELAPYAYQLVDGQRKEVRCEYRVQQNELTYHFPRGFSREHLLVIDPEVVFSSFTGAVSDNWGFTATYDAEGNFYAGGAVGGPQYPVSTGAFQAIYAGGGPVNPPAGTGAGGNYGPFQTDMVITKFNSDGTALLFSTFLGGNQNEQPHSLIVDSSNNLVIAGRTYSPDFPMLSASYDDSYNGGADIILARLNAGGTDLLASTYLGGAGDDGVNLSAEWNVFAGVKHSYADDARSEVIVDALGNVYLAASTRSADFPVVNQSQPALSGDQDAVVLKMDSSLSTLEWSTLLGGAAVDAAYVLALDRAQDHVYVAGGTNSTDFPIQAAWNGLMPAYRGGTSDGFIVKYLNSGAYGPVAGSFIGDAGYDQCFGVQVDLEDSVYVMGNTIGGGFPVQASVYGPVYSNPGSSQFIMKMSPALDVNIFSTVFGSGMSSEINITPVAFLVDTCQNIYISGWGGELASRNSTTRNMPVTTVPPNAAFQATTDGQDFYFVVFSKYALNLMYATYFGGGALAEHVDGGTSRFDRNGVIYQAICGGCQGSSAVPTTPGAYSQVNRSSNCNILAVKMAFNLGAVSADAEVYPSARGCLPLTVNFVNHSANATSYVWDFGDGSAQSNQREPVHTFRQAGRFTVMMAAHNPLACKVWDTAYLEVMVDTNRMTAGFSYQVRDSCDSFRVEFTNTSVLSLTPGADTLTRFRWIFGDGASYEGEVPPGHNYPGIGTYEVLMIMEDTTACNNPDTVRRTITIRSLSTRAQFSGPDTICVGDPAVFTDESVNSRSVRWDFGDGSTREGAGEVAHRYREPGTYTVMQVAVHPESCNGRDTAIRIIVVKPFPEAAFDYTPKVPEVNMPRQFINRSKNAVSYFWTFGDGNTSTDENPRHLYTRIDKEFNVCLIARSAEGCQDTACLRVSSDIRPLVDIPSAFSPNGDGSNDVLYVRGGAIARIHLRIFNRWGDLVFETFDLATGWDGRYNGVEQEMEVYAYTLTAEFTDGTSTSKQGNITLLR